MKENGDANIVQQFLPKKPATKPPQSQFIYQYPAVVKKGFMIVFNIIVQCFSCSKCTKFFDLSLKSGKTLTPESFLYSITLLRFFVVLSLSRYIGTDL